MEITKSGRKHLKDHERKLDVCSRWSVSDNRKVLTENIELKCGLCLTNHVLSTAYDQPAIVHWRQVQQGEAAVCFHGIDL